MHYHCFAIFISFAFTALAVPVQENVNDGIGDLLTGGFDAIGDIVGGVAGAILPGEDEQPPITTIIYQNQPTPPPIQPQTIVYGIAPVAPIYVQPVPVGVSVLQPRPTPAPRFIGVNQVDSNEEGYIYRGSRCSAKDPGACMSGKCCKDPAKAFAICMDTPDLRPEFSCWIPL